MTPYEVCSSESKGNTAELYCSIGLLPCLELAVQLQMAYFEEDNRNVHINAKFRSVKTLNEE